MLSTILVSLQYILISVYTLIHISLFKIYWENKIKLKATEEREPMLPWFWGKRVQQESHRLFILQERADSESAVLYTESDNQKILKINNRLTSWENSKECDCIPVFTCRRISSPSLFLGLQNFVCGFQVNINFIHSFGSLMRKAFIKPR